MNIISTKETNQTGHVVPMRVSMNLISNTTHTHTQFTSVITIYNYIILSSAYILNNILDVLLACAVGAAHTSEYYYSSFYKRCIVLSLIVMYAGLSCMETLVPAVCTMGV